MITPRHADTANVQLTADALWHRLIVGVEHVQAGVAQGFADRHHVVRHRHVRFQRPAGAVDRGFGRAIDVVQTHPRQPRTYLTRQRGTEFTAAVEHVGETGALLDVILLNKLLQQRRYELDHRHLMLANGLHHVRRIAVAIRLCQHQTHSGTQRPEDLPHRTVEAERGFLQQRAVLGRRTELRTPVHHVAGAAVFDHHAFGQPGRTRGVDHVGKVRSAQARHLRIACWLLRPTAAIKVDQRHTRFAQQLPRGAMHQQGDRRAVLQHVVEAFQRIVRVQRHIGAAGLEDAEQTNHQIQPALDADRHSRIRLHTQFTQVMGQTVGAFVEFAITQAAFTGLQRDGMRFTPRLGFEQGMQRLLQRAVDLGGVERAQQALQLLGLQDRQAVQRLLRRLLQRLHQAAQRRLHVTADPLRADLRHSPTGEAQAVAIIIHAHGQRIVGAFFVGQGFDALPGLPRGFQQLRFIAVPVVKQRAKQRRRRRHPTATLGQRQ
ncbi:hypothetical protein PseAD21_19145 [Pseudomonas sp. AD21]|nr:hypothetical protein PseAD21_19145 [Pseudomonas sp. AD21]